ncbi:FAD-dependent oxidoreductase [Streptosporangium sp. NPDC000396]|uniref:FAD-dependent oxidoreductase n=1 Tax=Streptosporangium sp. NPDC000396 TaxID=3366185 RepID=UPI0036BC4810
MGSIVVCGGGVVGLSAALLLARDGHAVTVLEADPAGPPPGAAQAWASWQRKGVAQFRQPHNLLPRFGQILSRELPEMIDRLLAAGCVWGDALAPLPPGITDRAPRPGDDRFRFITGRRPVVESVFAAAAEEEAGVTVRRGVRAAGLLAGPSAVAGTPHVAGVRTTDGQRIHADLVVDAMGKRTPSADWLAELGAGEPRTEVEDGGFVYYTRYFTGPEPPVRRAAPFTPMGTFSLLTIPGDNGTWSVTVVASTGDEPLRALREPGCFTRVVRACPAHAHWLAGTPVTGVLAMAGVLDRYRRFVVDDRPVVTGFAAVGDAWACTNPTAARGLSIGLIHAQVLRDVVGAHLDEPALFPTVWDERTERLLTPFYRDQISADRARIAEMDALRQGVQPPPPDPAAARFEAAAFHDADVFRALVETAACLAVPRDVLARPDLQARIDALGSYESFRAPGPDRGQLLRLLAE